MELFYLEKAEQLDNFIKNVSARSELDAGAEFLQSWSWGEILQREGEEILRVGVQRSSASGKDKNSDESNGQILAVVTLIKKSLSLGYSYWYAPRGPIQILLRQPADQDDKKEKAQDDKVAIENFLFTEIKKIDGRALFLRIEPESEQILRCAQDDKERDKQILRCAQLASLRERSGDDKEKSVQADKGKNTQADKRFFRIKKTLDGQPAQTLILDLKKDDKQILRSAQLASLRGRSGDDKEIETRLLTEMHQKTRYNLHLAEKKKVEIREGGLADLSEFWRLLNLTGERDNFRFHSLKHYQNLMQGEPGFIKLFLATYEGRNIAAGLFSFYGDKVTYLHGASDNKFRNVMAPYLLQWSVIKMAISEAYKYYDFYGIDEHKWPGVTRFKLGFGGRRVQYAGTYDVIFHPTAYRIYDFMRRLRRRF